MRFNAILYFCAYAKDTAAVLRKFAWTKKIINFVKALL
jgi:hypothetical protein